MMTRYVCWLNGQGLHDLDESVCILDIAESAPALRLQTAALAGREGQLVTARRRQQLTVTVTFEIHERDPHRRKAIADQARAWARDGWLSVSDRPGQRLYVLCEALPAVNSALRWTAPLTAVFTAYALPFWEAAYPARAEAVAQANTAASAALSPVGTAPWCLMDCQVENQGAEALTALTISSSTGDVLTLSAPSLLAPGDTLVLSHDVTGRLSITGPAGSLLHTRTAASADDLTLVPGQTAHPAVTADQPVKATFLTRGLFL